MPSPGETRRGRLGRALPLLYLALAMALAVVILPSVLRPPPEQQQSSAALRPGRPLVRR